LSQINQPSDLEITLIKGVESGLINKSQHDLVQATLTQIINHPELKEHFDGANKILNEQTIIEPKGQTIKPDRMAIDNNKNVYLLDYKTGSHQEKYKQQVDNYQQVIESMGYKVIKKALVYISKTVEVVHL
jgi:ATP-dependent exoDNAse (exonuclease V) beta subunit